MGCGNRWKGQTQHTAHNNQGERREEIAFCGFHDTPGSPCCYERKRKGRQVSRTGRESAI